MPRPLIWLIDLFGAHFSKFIPNQSNAQMRIVVKTPLNYSSFDWVLLVCIEPTWNFWAILFLRAFESIPEIDVNHCKNTKYHFHRIKWCGSTIVCDIMLIVCALRRKLMEKALIARADHYLANLYIVTRSPFEQKKSKYLNSSVRQLNFN